MTTSIRHDYIITHSYHVVFHQLHRFRYQTTSSIDINDRLGTHWPTAASTSPDPPATMVSRTLPRMAGYVFLAAMEPCCPFTVYHPVTMYLTNDYCHIAGWSTRRTMFHTINATISTALSVCGTGCVPSLLLSRRSSMPHGFLCN